MCSSVSHNVPLPLMVNYGSCGNAHIIGRHQLKHICRLLYFLNMCGPKDELRLHSRGLRHSCNATKLRPPPTGRVGFNTVVRFLVLKTAFN